VSSLSAPERLEKLKGGLFPGGDSNGGLGGSAGDYAAILNSFRCRIFVCRENNGLLSSRLSSSPFVPSLAHCSFTARPANDVLTAPGSAELSSMPFGPAPYFPSALFFVADARKLLTYFIFRADISGPRASRHRGINRALESCSRATLS